MLSRQLIASLSPTLFTHQSNDATACWLCFMPSCFFCNVVCLLLQISIKADVKRTELHADSDWPARLPDWCSHCVYIQAAAVYHNHCVPLSVSPSTACRRSPSDRPAHLTHVQAFDSATMRQHLGALWGGDVDNFCVWIIRNCCPNYWRQKIIPFQPQNHVWIIREVELLEWIWYT